MQCIYVDSSNHAYEHPGKDIRHTVAPSLSSVVLHIWLRLHIHTIDYIASSSLRCTVVHEIPIEIKGKLLCNFMYSR